MGQSVTRKPLLGDVGGAAIDRPYIHVEFQSGLPQVVGVNGCRVEDVIDVAIQRLQEYESGPLACIENEDAIVALRDARRALELRRLRRSEQGVLNTMYQHETHRTEDQEQDFSATGA